MCVAPSTFSASPALGNGSTFDAFGRSYWERGNMRRNLKLD